MTAHVHGVRRALQPRVRTALADRPRRILAGLELATGAMALVGGGLLVVSPDGSLLHADPTVLVGSPFPDYRWPGVLLASFVGGGYLVTGFWQARSGFGARHLSVVAGVGLVAFEASELLWLGFQPLEAVFALVGATVAAMALLAPAPTRRFDEHLRGRENPGEHPRRIGGVPTTPGRR
jgi:hypothetical protein